MYVRPALLFTCAAGLAILIGCGGSSGGGGGSSTGVTSGSTAGGSFETRLTAVTALTAKYQQLAPRSNPAQRPAMVAYAQSLSGIESAGWTDIEHGDNFYAILKDGTPYAMLDNRPILNAPALSPISTNPTRAAKIVPLATSARVIHSLGGGYTNNTAIMSSLLTEAGYSPQAMTGTLTELANSIKGVGYFYWGTHSGWIGEPQFPIISTNTKFSEAMDGTPFVKDLYAKKLITLCGGGEELIPNPVDTNKNGKIDEEEKVKKVNLYAIRPEFIKAYFKFSPNSVVLQDSCTSADAAFRNVFLAAGASVYVGWDKITSSTTQMALLTDRMMGGNRLPPLDTPPDRPFDLENVMAWMLSKGLATDTLGAKMNAVRLTGTDGGILSPSIQSIQINEGHMLGKPSTVVITGIFGPKNDALYKREVLVSGQPLKVVDGNDTSITAEIPNTGVASAGPCVVIIAQRKSNEIPISLFSINMTYTLIGTGTFKVVDTINYKLRLDLHRNRAGVAATPGGDIAYFFGRSDSKASFVASGTGTYDGCTHSITGTGTVTPGLLGNPVTIELVGEFDRATGTFPSFQPLVFFDPNLGSVTTTCPGGGGPGTEPGGIPSMVGYDTEPKVLLDDITYAILPGQTTWVTGFGIGTLKWNLSIPQYAPKETTKA